MLQEKTEGGAGRRISVYDLEAHSVLYEVEMDAGEIPAGAVSPDGTMAALCDAAGRKLYLMDMKNARKRPVLREFEQLTTPTGIVWMD